VAHASWHARKRACAVYVLPCPPKGALLPSLACAPQVLEETGLDIDSMVRPDDMIEATSDNKLCQLFIVTGLDPEAAKFAPQVQKVSTPLRPCGAPPLPQRANASPQHLRPLLSSKRAYAPAVPLLRRKW